LRGFLWENYDGQQIFVSQSYWRSHIDEPKTKKSQAPVPIVAQLAERLDLHRKLSGNSPVGLIFVSPVGKPMNLDALVREVIRPALAKAGLVWHGWHAFRRGLASNLNRLGIDDSVIQANLRHSDPALTQRCYIKTVRSDAVAAMGVLERSLKYAPSMHLAGTKGWHLM
jgi:integrase